MKYIRILELKGLSSEVKENIYNKLIKGDYKTELTFYNKEGKTNDIEILFYNNDLCVSSWSLNFYQRTSKAVKFERYKTFGQAITQLKRMLKKYPVQYSNLHVYTRGSYIRGTRKHLFDIEL